MARPQLLLVDADPRSVRVLEATLQNDGFSVTAAADGAEALNKLKVGLPDVLVVETRSPRLDGFELVKRLRELPGGRQVAVVFIAPEEEYQAGSPRDMKSDLVRAAELGVENCLCKPILVRELIVRIRLLLARRQQAIVARPDDRGELHFSGRLQDTSMVDLLLSLDRSRRSGCLRVVQGPRAAIVFFRNGKVVDAEQGRLQGEEAVYRTLLWSSGLFEFQSGEVRCHDVVTTGAQGLLMEGMRRIEEWGRLAEQLPSSAAVFEVDANAFLERLPEIPDELNPIVRLIDGAKTLMEVIDVSPFDDLSTLSVVSKLYFDGVLRLVDDKSEAQALLPTAIASATRGDALLRHGEASVRPTAPPLGAENVPRHLVYSEPPQSQRWSQRVQFSPVDNTEMGLNLLRDTGVTESRLTAEPVSAAESLDAVADASTRRTSSTGAGTSSTTTVSARHGEELGRGNEVDEAEFEDLASESPEGAKDPAQRSRGGTILGMGLVGRAAVGSSAVSSSAVSSSAASNETAEQHSLSAAVSDDSSGRSVAPMTQPSTRANDASAVARGADDKPASPTVPVAPTPEAGSTEGATRPAEPVEHLFFSEGEQGTYEGGPASVEPVVPEVVAEAEDRPSDEIDPALLAVLGERRQQSRRWVARIVGVALLLSLWGLFMLWKAEPIEDGGRDAEGLQREPVLGQGEPSPPPSPPSVNDTEEPDTDLEEPDFAEVESQGATEQNSSLGVTPPTRLRATAGQGTPAKPSASKPSSRQTQRKPPTARFPSTAEAK